MLFLKSKTTNPYFNIATEEYLLKNFDTDFFFLYTNKPSIIVGKHQNTMAEINIPFVYENNINVVRRLSGGGTVFHDLGNLNYCFIQNGKEGFLVDFKKYSQPIINTLQKLNINAYLKGKSDLVIDDLKFSGNAEHVYKNKVLHHGTMLFSSELTRLNEAIKSDWSKYEDKAVRSNRSKVTNIREHLQNEMSIVEFQKKVEQEVLSQTDISEYVLSENDIHYINHLIDEKYKTWDWNFGYSPKFKISQEQMLNSGLLKAELNIKKGIIEKADISLNGNQHIELNKLEVLLPGMKYEYQEISELVIKTLGNSIFEEDLIKVIQSLF